MRPGTQGFTGERLKAARESRGITTATSLAEMIGVSRVAVSQYERGLQTPSPTVMREICDRLNLPIQYFLLPPTAPAGTLFFRSMASATKAERLRASRQFEWLRDLSDTIASFVKFPSVDIPRADTPEDPLKITDEMIEDASLQLRRHWRLGDGPISDVCLLMENKGCIISQTDTGTDRLDAFSKWDERRQRPFMVLGTEKSAAVRSRANAAHELAHLVLHRHLTDSDLKKPHVFKEVERQAFQFAGAFLLPESSFLRELYGMSLETLLEKKPRWKVSVALMLKRSEDTGLVTEAQAKQMWISLSRRGWKRKEPLDDAIPIERPRLLRRCVEMIVERGLLKKNELPLFLGLPASDIERLTGLPETWLTIGDGEIRDEVEPRIIKFPNHRGA